MRIRLRTAVSVAAMVLIVSSSAFAQFESRNTSPIGLRMSAFKPMDAQLSGISDTWLSPTIDYNMKFDAMDRPTRTISLTWFGNSNSSAKGKFIPLTYNYTKRFYTEEEDGGWYAGVGLGIAKVSVDAYNFMRGWKNSSSTNIGFSLSAGYELNDALFAELKYTQFGSVDNPNADKVSFEGLVLSVGTHIAY